MINLPSDIWLVPRTFSPYNHVYNIKTKGPNEKFIDTPFWIKTEYHFWKKFLTKWPGTLSAWKFYDYSRPTYSLYRKNQLVAVAKTGLTKNKHRRLEFEFADKKREQISAVREKNKIVIHDHEDEIRCEIKGDNPPTSVFTTEMCGYGVEGNSSLSSRFRLIVNKTKVKLLDVFHSRIFHISAKEDPRLPIEFICMLVYFWERNNSISLVEWAGSVYQDVIVAFVLASIPTWITRHNEFKRRLSENAGWTPREEKRT
jgi:hypothetical protein